jgi:diacylglycerol kinase (ATP)
MQDPRTAAAPDAAVMPARNDRPLRVGLLTNRLSTRNRKGMAGLQDALSRHSGVRHMEIEDWAQFEDAAARLADENLDLLVVNGGDGTVVGLVTELRRRGSRPLPALAILASGNTNMIAGDVGQSGAPGRALSRLLGAASTGWGLQRVQRRLIRIDREGEPTRYGFFVAAFAVVRAILLTRRFLNPLGVHHGPANAAGMALAALRVLLGPKDGEGLLSPVPVEVGFDDEPARSADCSVMFASTLERLLFGATPFWGAGPGPIRTTLVRGPVDRPLLSLLPLLRGRPGPRMERSGYISRNADRVMFSFDGPFMIDGEIHQVSRARPITLSDGGAVEFLQA